MTDMAELPEGEPAEGSAEVRKQNIGDVCDLLGVPMPSEIEDGDIITDVVVVCVYQGEEGESVTLAASEGMSWLKLMGVAHEFDLLAQCWLDGLEERGGSVGGEG